MADMFQWLPLMIRVVRKQGENWMGAVGSGQEMHTSQDRDRREPALPGVAGIESILGRSSIEEACTRR